MPDALSFALASLARREYSAFELREKLQGKGFEEDAITAAITECQRLGYQSDERYVDSYCRMRVHRGDGPAKIQHFLCAKGIDSVIIAQRLDQENWFEIAHQVLTKKYGLKQESTTSLSDKTRQYRFMQSRGFSSALIHSLLK